MIWLGITALLLVAFAIRVIRRRGRPLEPEKRFRIELDETEIAVAFPSGERPSLKWDQVTMIGIRTTSDGPWRADVFWGLHDETGAAKVVFPGGATGERELMTEIARRFPDVRHDEIIRAMGSTSDAWFKIWERQRDPGSSLH